MAATTPDRGFGIWNSTTAASMQRRFAAQVSELAGAGRRHRPHAAQTRRHPQQVENLCDEAIRYRFACAMVNPMWVSTAVGVLSGTGIPVGAVIGFPLGASLVSTCAMRRRR
jgi:hypothetical protein